MKTTLEELARALASEERSGRALVEDCLARATAPEGEGRCAFITLHADSARARADALDRARARGRAPSRWAGIPLSVKDLFDLAGEVTRAGSTLLASAEPARATAPAIDRLLRAGFVVVGRTNMTEFAYSGVGINPHYGTPRNPFDRATGRIPGGSSSGAAISVTDGMAFAGIGTDTGGSCRIPAALTGLVGFKPTASAVPRDGVYPLSESLDSVGSIASSVACAATLHDVMRGGGGQVPQARSPATLRLAVLEHYVIESLDETVATGYGQALERLAAAGAELTPVRLPAIETLPELNAGGGIAAAEAYAFHRRQLAIHESEYDPRVASRIKAGADVTREELGRIRMARAGMIEAFARLMDPYDALLAPSVPVIAPPMTAFETDAEYVRLNLLLLRNPSLFNFLDGCAISIPVHEPGSAPVGLMLAAPGGRDRALLAVAAGAGTVFP
ncbi:MAG: amidase [Pseudomonadales bacterium]